MLRPVLAALANRDPSTVALLNNIGLPGDSEGGPAGDEMVQAIPEPDEAASDQGAGMTPEASSGFQQPIPEVPGGPQNSESESSSSETTQEFAQGGPVGEENDDEITTGASPSEDEKKSLWQQFQDTLAQHVAPADGKKEATRTYNPSANPTAGDMKPIPGQEGKSLFQVFQDQVNKGTGAKKFAAGGPVEDDEDEEERTGTTDDESMEQTGPAGPGIPEATAPVIPGSPEKGSDDDMDDRIAKLWAKGREAILAGLRYGHEEAHAVNRPISDPEHRASVNAMLRGEGAADYGEMKALSQAVDPQGKLTQNDRTNAMMATVYGFYNQNQKPPASSGMGRGAPTVASTTGQQEPVIKPTTAIPEGAVPELGEGEKAFDQPSKDAKPDGGAGAGVGAATGAAAGVWSLIQTARQVSDGLFAHAQAANDAGKKDVAAKALTDATNSIPGKPHEQFTPSPTGFSRQVFGPDGKVMYSEVISAEDAAAYAQKPFDKLVAEAVKSKGAPESIRIIRGGVSSYADKNGVESRYMPQGQKDERIRAGLPVPDDTYHQFARSTSSKTQGPGRTDSRGRHVAGQVTATETKESGYEPHPTQRQYNIPGAGGKGAAAKDLSATDDKINTVAERLSREERAAATTPQERDAAFERARALVSRNPDKYLKPQGQGEVQPQQGNVPKVNPQTQKPWQTGDKVPAKDGTPRFYTPQGFLDARQFQQWVQQNKANTQQVNQPR